ncbi:MAG: DUF362 domain-containing protein [Anaerolineae bacterium]
MSTVVITRNERIERAIEEALGRIDVEPLVRGKLVAVKPNETYATKESRDAVTQPDTLRAVLRHIKQFGPRELVVTGGAGAAETEDVFRIVGLMEVVEEEGAMFFDHNRAPFERVNLTYAPGKDVSGPQEYVMVNPRVLEYETLIALNQLKLHATATVTMALKNIAMSFPAADYYGHPRSKEYHKHEFFADMHSFIAAMARRFPIDLAITAGHPAMIGTGPVEGHAVETGLVIASTDAVAADAVGAKLLGFNADAVHHLWEAGRMGLDQVELEQMTFPAMSLEEAIAAFTEAAYGVALGF